VWAGLVVVTFPPLFWFVWRYRGHRVGWWPQVSRATV